MSVVLSPIRANYQVQHSGEATTLVGGSKALPLFGVEWLKFADATVTFDIGDSAGEAVRLYQAAFDRTPDSAGLRYWISQMGRGGSLRDAAASFIRSQEFEKPYGRNPSDEAFTVALYENVLHRPDKSGVDYWMGELAGGFDRPGMPVSFSESVENKCRGRDTVVVGCAGSYRRRAAKQIRVDRAHNKRTAVA